jgi:hypothetical protein
MKKLAGSLLLHLVCLILCPHLLQAQESTNFKLKEHIFNEGGNPENGIILSSANFKVTLDAIGEALVGTSLSSASFHMDAGFVPPYPPPGEVLNLMLQSDHETLIWDPEKSRGSYSLYRDLLSNIKPDYGACKEYGITDETTTDSEDPGVGNGYFYLVTVRNRLAEEGTKGYDSADAERSNLNPCP